MLLYCVSILLPNLVRADLGKEWQQILYVAPGGDDRNSGSEEQPLATVQRALQRLDSSESAAILLKEGVYTESVEVTGMGAPLLIAAAHGEEVWFEGGQKLVEWKMLQGEREIYVADIPDRESMFGHTGYLDFWDQTERVRYGKMADIQAVRHWPGSMTISEDHRIFFRPHQEKSLQTLNLWVNRLASGITVKRNRVTIRGLHFRNYLGGREARALTITGCREVNVVECLFVNCTMGISNTGEDVSVLNSEFREVGMGIRHAGQARNILIRGCLFESAVGLFAFSDVGEHMRNGIRIYFRGDGAVIEDNLTTGFWAGLYIKTISGELGAQPYTIRGNTFLDGIRSGADCRHPQTTIENNIIGTPSTREGAGVRAGYYLEMGATIRNNLFIGRDAIEIEEPLADMQAGDLTILRVRGGALAEVGAKSFRQVSWSPRMARYLAGKKRLVERVRMIAPPQVVSSSQGALVSCTYNDEVKVGFRYRQTSGVRRWNSVEGRDLTIYMPENMIASIPFEPCGPDQFTWIFPVPGEDLESGRSYEYELRTEDKNGNPVDVSKGRFVASGEAKMIHVAPDSREAHADGSSQYPFTDLQTALNHALPGDTLRLAAGLYTQASVLTHGGTEAAPITIEGAGWEKTILDGGKRVGTLLEVRNAPHVIVRGIQFRWFGNYGVTVTTSPGFRLEESWIWNQGFNITGVGGVGLYIRESSGAAVSGCLFNRLQNGVMVYHSPQFRFTHNTAFSNLYSGLDLFNSAENSVIAYNSLTFTGNRALYIREQDEEAFRSLVCDYNNYACRLREDAPQRPENDIQSTRYGRLAGQSKGIVAITMGKDYWRDFHSMKEWRIFSGKDKNSLFEDPQYVSPIDWDFRVLPESPNRLVDGKVIGILR